MIEFPTDKWLKISYKDTVIDLVAIVRYKKIEFYHRLLK